MTDHRADDMAPTDLDPVTDAQLAAEPPPPELGAYARSAAEYDALARRIEAAASAELTRRAALRGGRPPLVVVRTTHAAGRVAGRARGRDELTPLFARALRPALFAAAAAGLLAVGLARLGTGPGSATGQELSDASAVQALSLHDPSAQWPDQARAPSVDALGRAIGLGGAP